MPLTDGFFSILLFLALTLFVVSLALGPDVERSAPRSPLEKPEGRR